VSDSLSKQEWINRVLGVSVVQTNKAPKKVTFSDKVSVMPPPPTGMNLGEGRKRSGAVIAPPPKATRPQKFTTETGKEITISRDADGAPLFTAPPPPVREISFSGGGGKGAALPGAVKALEDSGALKDVTQVYGASVGSMTAAILAAGITAKEFSDVANADETTARITEGSGGTKLGLLMAAAKNKVTSGSGNPLTGDGLESVVRDVLDETLRKRIMEYVQECIGTGKTPDNGVVGIAKRLSGNKAGPTFGEMRQLSKAIPAIKEVVITGTYTTEFEEDDKGKLKKVKDGNDQGQLYIFSADTEPDLEVAVAVHASASFPAAFKPVDIKLSTGMTVRFIDGGVMNNTPTSSSIGNERALDPMPDKRGITFVFEDKEGVSKGLLEGKVTPSQGKKARLVDWFVGSSHKGAEYAKDRDMTDRPEEIVEVPLKVRLPPKKPGKKGKKVDMRDGTLEFNLSLEKKIALQEATENATNEQIEREKQPKTRKFASDSQMFVSIGMSDLKALKASGYAGADAAYDFREKVAEMIEKLREAVKKENAKSQSQIANVLQDKDATMALDELDKLAGEDVDFQGYVGRELNKGGLDSLLEAARKGGVKSGAMDATYAVSDTLKARNFASNTLKNVIYPQMKVQGENGSGIETLLVVEGLLRAAQTPEDVNEALTIAVDHFKNKSDKLLPRKGHKQFAQRLESIMMPLAA
jgi:exoenzyme U